MSSADTGNVFTFNDPLFFSSNKCGSDANLAKLFAAYMTPLNVFSLCCSLEVFSDAV